MRRDPPLPPAIWHPRSAEGNSFVARMPMTVDQAIDVFELVANLLAQEEPRVGKCGCDGDFRRVAEICQANGADVARVELWLKDQGAKCDCEVFKVDQKFDELVQLDDEAWEAEVRRQIASGALPRSYERFL